MAPLVSNLPQMKTIIEDLGDDAEKPESGEFIYFVFHITFMVFDVVFSCEYALIIELL